MGRAEAGRCRRAREVSVTLLHPPQGRVLPPGKKGTSTQAMHQTGLDIPSENW